MRLPLLLSLILSTACVTVTAQSEDCDESPYLFPMTEFHSGGVGRYFSLSTASPVTRVIRANRSLSNQIEPLYDLFQKFTTIIETRQRNNDSLACNLPIRPYFKQSTKFVQKRQFGTFGDIVDCPSRIDVDIAVQRNELTEQEEEQSYATVHNGLEALYQAASRINVIPTNENWTTLFRPFGFEQTLREQICIIDSVFAYISYNRFFIRASVTNWPPNIPVEDFGRQHINEYVPREGNTALKGPHIKFGTECEFENSSTQLTRYGGRSPRSHGGIANLGQRFGVIQVASRANSIAVDVAEDSLTGSNIAILALPMVMNFVPVAFVAELSTFAMVCYVIFTDIFSTIPFMIKGVELIQTGNGMRRAMGAYYLGNSTLGQMEIFSAACRGKESYRNMGILFVVLAILLMALGVFLEVHASRIMRRRRLKGEQGPFGQMMDYDLGYGPLGGHSEEEKMRRFTFEMMIEEGIGARDKRSGSFESGKKWMPRLPKRISTKLMTGKKGE